eukprot:TRINITY_DN17435_c0_g1_i2.p1 TRINITY_DN17435_c0_g1~~TRINITY_DN17435_c0_g1_i2.p1  ORF type:complete len:399 (+),score=83.38 TRINITY_DN17435_c0_g1_i2:563-1759(+)
MFGTMMSALVAAALAMSPPKVPDAFSAISQMEISPPSSAKFSGPYWYDLDNQRECIKINTIAPEAPKDTIGTPGQWSNVTEFIMKSGVYYGVNGLTRLIIPETKFPNQFEFVALSRYNGTEMVDGRNCTVWNFHPDNKTFMRYYAEVGTDIPVGIFSNVTSKGLPGQPPSQSVTLTTFKNVVTDRSKIDFSVFKEFNLTEINNPPACRPKNSPPVVQDMEMYIFHPSKNWNISGQDVADLVGDTFFVCADSTNTDRDHYQYISKYSISMNTNWGQYRMCNDYPPTCVGAEDFLIGREASEGLGPVQSGQCSDNTETGSWLSLPEKGECQGSDTPASGKCTWKINKRIKTIDGKCMLGRGLVDACKVDQRLPFPTASKIFYSSFDDQDGCPAINPPSGF